VWFALARWGLRGIFEWNKPWRYLLVLVASVLVSFGGYRSGVELLFLLFFVQFMVEGLWKTPLLPILFLLGVLCLMPVLFFASKMPGAVQRSISFLPVDIDPAVRADAAYSTDWRVNIWRTVLPEVPKYLLLGKGYGMNPAEFDLVSEEAQMGLTEGYEVAIASGEYHSGPLSVLIPLGLFGAIAVFFVLRAGVKVLQSNRRYGDPRLRRVNDFLFAYFIAHIIQFVFVFGAFDAEFYTFLGVVGFSVGLNGGVCRKAAVQRQAVLSPTLAAPLTAA
jgi:hypothetical protein